MASNSSTTPTPLELVDRYYDALDTHEYDALEAVLAPSFVQERPDRTFETRDAFVRFMRDGRPNPDTSHEIDDRRVAGDRVIVRGRVLDRSDGDGDSSQLLFSFVDTFTVADGRLVHLETRSRSSDGE